MLSNQARFTRLVLAMALATGPVLARTSALAAGAGPPPSPPNSAAVGRLELSGYGTKLAPPAAPTLRPFSQHCQQLVDPAFQGTCAIVRGRQGWAAGVVEVERGATGSQERDLVWRRRGQHWALVALRLMRDPGHPALLWTAPVRPGHAAYLVFVSPVARSGFGADLQLVPTLGKVVLYRYLGQGFATVPPLGGLLTYVPGFTEARPANSYFDQTLVGYSAGAWRVLSQQYVPYRSALGQHRGVFWGAGVVAAR